VSFKTSSKPSDQRIHHVKAPSSRCPLNLVIEGGHDLWSAED
jgi:hypothetical protein